MMIESLSEAGPICCWLHISSGHIWNIRYIKGKISIQGNRPFQRY